MLTLTDDTVLTATPHCVVREQEDHYVVYNSRTDELHLIPALGHYLYRLCDGMHDIGTICRTFSPGAPDTCADTRKHVMEYFGKLVDRGILQGEPRA